MGPGFGVMTAGVIKSTLGSTAILFLFSYTQLFMIVEVDHGLNLYRRFRPQNTNQKHCQLLCPTALRARSL